MTTPQPRQGFDATITRLVARAPDTRSLFLRPADGHRLAFLPGQFLSCLLPVDGKTLTRPYSIASDPGDDELEICLNLVPGGQGSAYLFGLGVGDTLRCTGPWGTFTLDEVPAAECVFVAEGTGIAPIRPMLRRVLRGTTAPMVRLHYAAESTAHLLYADEFGAAARADARFVYEPLIGTGLEALVLQRYVAADSDRSRRFYLCAVGDIVTRLRDALRRAGYERRAVQYEKW